MKMVEPNRKHRYGNASFALKALQSIEIVGTATRIDTLISTIKLRRQATVLGLVTVITLAAVAGTLMSCQPGDTVRQLLEATECPSFDFSSGCQEKTGN